jgi:hypothetical protein
MSPAFWAIIATAALLVGVVYIAARLSTKDDPTVRMSNLCWTGTTLYAIDVQGRVWYIEMRTGTWALHGNPTKDVEVENAKP